MTDNAMNSFGKNPILYCPNGVEHASIPYIISYLSCPWTKDFHELLNANTDTVLFSWTYLWQDIEWVEKINKPVFIGGSAVKYLAYKGELPKHNNVTYSTEDIDSPNEPSIMPDYSIVIQENPLVDFLKVYSGFGCNWGRCTFCTWVGSAHTQFDPEYIAKVILHANSFGKLAGLSAPTHTVQWLQEVEKYLPGKYRRYWAYMNAHDNKWSKLTKVKDIFIGSEYLSDAVLRRVKKGVTASKIMNSIIEILSAGINVYSTIIEDLYETEDELQEHMENKLRLLSVTAPPRLGYGKLWLASCRLINNNYYETDGCRAENETGLLNERMQQWN